VKEGGAAERSGRGALARAAFACALAGVVVAAGALPAPVAARAVSARAEARPARIGGEAAASAGDAKALRSPRKAAARAGGEEGISRTPSETKPHWVCPDGPCAAIVDPKPVRVAGKHRLALPDGGAQLEGSGEEGGYDPQDLQSAYEISTNGGAAGETIAIVDAYGFVEAEHSLAVYRERYGLPPCTRESQCFRKVNEQGQESSYPVEDGWKGEQALDIEMVSAACPECHILLVQADDATGKSLDEAENTAVRLGAVEVSNSWSGPEQDCGSSLSECEGEEREYFDHPGVMLFFAAGDHGYDNTLKHDDSPDFPAALPSVVAVGGTALHRADNARGWSEETWYEPGRGSGGGSGCSRFEKPGWQGDPGCPGRMTVDVAADAACATPVSVYDGGWELICGTSASSPLVAGIEAHAEEYVRSLPGAEAFYEASAGLDDVTQGVNGECSDAPLVAYFCRAEVGYDGPAGNGSPWGPLVLAGAAPAVSTRPASDVRPDDATLGGYVSPRGLSTGYWFEYGTTTAYGASIPVPEGSIGTSGQAVSQTIGELEPETVYHYRLVASNSDGTSYGADVAFSTGAPRVTGVTPGTSAADGTGTVTITGANLIGASEVSFGSVEAPQFTVESDGSISATVPGGTGPVDVTVTTPSGTSTASAASRFIYDPPGPALAWGENGGDLGNAGIQSSDVPVETSGLPEAQLLSSGWEQSLALLNDGRLLAWGENYFGVVGDGTNQQRTTPVQVCALGVSECAGGPYLEGVTQVSAGRLPSLALLSDGTVAAWGGNYYGDLATDTARNFYPLPVCTKLESPCKPENYLREVVEVAAGADFSLARLKNGTVMAWGENTEGALGDGTTTGPETCGEEHYACSRIPVQVSGLSEVSAIAAGSWDALALLKNGTMMAWGGNERGQLGDGEDITSDVPRTVCALAENGSCTGRLGEVKSISAGYFDSYALLKNGTVVAWGSDFRGALGEKSARTECVEEREKERVKLECSEIPVLVKGLSHVSALAQGELTRGGLVALEDGQLETWGEGEYGQLGDGTIDDSYTPAGVCAAYAPGPCPDGPYLHGEVTAMASGSHDLVSLVASKLPTVSELAPEAGSAGTRVSIVGGHLEGASAVHFGATPATEFEIRSDEEVLAVVPAGSGTVDVTVTTPQGTSAVGPESEFTYAYAPTAVTGIATGISLSGATLNATVDPDGAAVSDCLFEYGTSPSYGTSVPCSPSPGSGVKPVAVSANLGGLQAHRTYYFRVLVTNADGTAYGAEQTFTTNTLPALGRCVKVTAADAQYASKTCTTPSAGADSGHYEWEPWPIGDAHFQISLGELNIADTDFPELRCSAGSGSGEYTGPQSATISLVLTGCTYVNERDSECKSAGAAAGEIRTTVPAQLGYIQAGAKPSIGWALNAPAEKSFANFDCNAGVAPTSLSGSVIAAVTSADKMSNTAKLKFEGSKGVQAPTHLEGGPEDVLDLIWSYQELPASLHTTATLENQEPLELLAMG